MGGEKVKPGKRAPGSSSGLGFLTVKGAGSSRDSYEIARGSVNGEISFRRQIGNLYQTSFGPAVPLPGT